MTDSMFDQYLDRQLREYAEGGVQPFDRYAIAEGLIASGGRGKRLAWFPALGRPVFSPTAAMVIIGLLLALLAAVVVGAYLLRMHLSQPPGRNGFIAYSLSDIPERPYNHLRIVNPDGTGDREIAQGAAPVFSADGQRITYFTGWGIDEDNLELVQANADGSDDRVISDRYQQTGFYPSPDGKLVLVSEVGVSPTFRDEGWSLLIVGSEGQYRTLLPGPPESLSYGSFQWSPDGSQIAYSLMQDVTTPDNGGRYRAAIEVVDVASGEVRRLTSRAGTDTSTFAWSPDSRYIAYTGIPDGTPLPSLDPGGEFNPPMDVFVIDADGTDETNLTDSAAANHFPAWAPDGAALSYDEFIDSDPFVLHVVVQPMSGSKAVGEPAIGPEGIYAESIVWSPDALLLAYTVTTDVTPPGSETQQLHSVIQTIDREFKGEPFTVVEYDFGIGSLAWQWLKP